MDKKRAEKILNELKKREQKIDLFSSPQSFPEQTKFIQDQSKLKSLLTSRRGGKSYAIALDMVNTCLTNPIVTCAYIGLTRDSAKNVIIPHLKKIKKDFNIKCRFYKSPASVQFANGSNILFFGINDTEEEREKLLGQHFKLAAIDEGASYTIDLQATIRDFIEPTLWDDDGQLVIIGTPGNHRNYFCDITTGQVPGWSNHFWLTDKNPTTSKKYLQEVQEKRRLYPTIDEDPGFQQHYLGRWTIDTEKILYRYSKTNLIQNFQPKHDLKSYIYILSIDLGWNDQNAFVIAAYHQYDKQLYILETFAKSEMVMDEIIIKIQEFQKKYPISTYVIDAGGSQKAYVESLRYRTRLPFIAATKPEKLKFIQMMNSDLICQKIMIQEPKCQELLNEWNTITKLEESHLYEKVVGSQKDHAADAALYAWRYSYHYNAQAEPVTPPIHSETKVDQWWQEQEQRMEEEKERPFWDT